MGTIMIPHCGQTTFCAHCGTLARISSSSGTHEYPRRSRRVGNLSTISSRSSRGLSCLTISGSTSKTSRICCLNSSVLSIRLTVLRSLNLLSRDSSCGQTSDNFSSSENAVYLDTFSRPVIYPPSFPTYYRVTWRTSTRLKRPPNIHIHNLCCFIPINRETLKDSVCITKSCFNTTLYITLIHRIFRTYWICLLVSRKI